MQIKSEHNPTLHLGKRAGVAQEVSVPREGQEIRDFQQFFFLNRNIASCGRIERHGMVPAERFFRKHFWWSAACWSVKNRANKSAFISFMHSVFRHLLLLCSCEDFPAQNYDSVKSFFFFLKNVYKGRGTSFFMTTCQVLRNQAPSKTTKEIFGGRTSKLLLPSVLLHLEEGRGR